MAGAESRVVVLLYGGIIALMAMSGRPQSVGAQQFDEADSLRPAITDEQLPFCTGDCDGNGDVSVDEVVALVGIELGTTSRSCVGSSGGIDGIVASINRLLSGCPGYRYELTSESRFSTSSGGEHVEAALSGYIELVPSVRTTGNSIFEFVWRLDNVRSETESWGASSRGRLRAVGLSVQGLVDATATLELSGGTTRLAGTSTLAAVGCGLGMGCAYPPPEIHIELCGPVEGEPPGDCEEVGADAVRHHLIIRCALDVE